MDERPVVAYMFDRLAEGDTFEAWPTHLTLIPPASRNAADVQHAVEEATKGARAVPITIGAPDTFGSSDAPVSVFHVEPARELRDLHRSILAKLGGSRAVHDAVQEWLDTEYAPHVTPKPGQKVLTTGEEYCLDNLAIIGKEGGQRIVRRIVELER